MTFPAVAIRPRRSMMLFAVLAILMVIASYVFVLLLAALCIFIPYRLSTTPSTGTEPTLLLLFGVIIAGAILCPCFHDSTNFKAPGPQLERAENPELFSELDHIAASLNEPLPQEVYLVGDVNAWVADRGGSWVRQPANYGAGPAAYVDTHGFTIPSGLAHEFAHYYGATQVWGLGSTKPR